MLVILSKEITEKESWDIIKPICRELYELVNGGNIQFVSGIRNENNGTYKVNLKKQSFTFRIKRVKR